MKTDLAPGRSPSPPETTRGFGPQVIPSASASGEVWMPVAAESLVEIGQERGQQMRRILLSGKTGGEVSRVLGGGVVPGTLILVGGDPGIGKSTLLLQVAALIAKQDADSGKSDLDEENEVVAKKRVLYVSAEESKGQIFDRAARLGFGDLESLYVLNETKIENVLMEIMKMRPDAVVMDSIQAVSSASATGGSGSYAQVRECGIMFHHCAMTVGVPIFIVGHVTKEGGFAGPKVLEHIVDVVLYLEGKNNEAYRILRSVKNRYGSTEEIGIFEMAEGRLVGVDNPNMTLLHNRAIVSSNVSSAIAVTMEGSRPILMEVQARTTPIMGNRESIVGQSGIHPNRLFTITAILRGTVKCRLERVNLLTNVTGGMRIKEPAGDMAIAVAIASSYFEQPISKEMALIGEMGLGGEILPVNQLEKRLAEVSQLGFKMAVVPRSKTRVKMTKKTEMAVHECGTIVEVLELILGKEAITRKQNSQKRRRKNVSDEEDDSDSWMEEDD